jgi:sugar lactone lactonase YvrE
MSLRHAMHAVGLVGLFVAGSVELRGRDPEPSLEVLFQLPLAPAGMTVAPGGDFVISVSFEEKPENRVIEVTKTGESKPFPNSAISKAEPDEPLTLDAVQGMQTDKDGIVWMLDSGRRGEVPPKIVAWDAGHKRLHRVINLSQPAVLSGSNVDDIAVESEHPVLYVSDPANGADAALVVVDIPTGLARRVLQGHPSVVPVAGLDLVIDGRKIQSRRLDGSVADPQGGVKPFALDRHGEWLYFGPMRSLKLYRIKTEHLRNAALSGEKLAGLVEEYSAKPLCAGISIDFKNNIYVSDLGAKAIGMIAAVTKEYRVLTSDPRLIWPDGLCFGPDGRLHFFSNVRRARSRGAKAEVETNYLFRLQTPGSGRVGD